MSRWFRHYAGMMRDDKLVRVAIKSKQPIERVLWIWGAILESAAEIDDGGRYDVDAAEIAYFLRADECDVAVILGGFDASGRTADGAVVKWGDRQFQSDKSNARVAAHRERKRAEKLDDNKGRMTGNGDVTLQRPNGNAPETETETETETDGVAAKATTPARKRAVLHAMPKDWEPILTASAQQTVDGWPPGLFNQQLAAFIDHAADKGRTSKDWQAAFRTWISRTNERTPKHGNQNFRNGGGNGPDKRDGLAKALDRIIAGEFREVH